MLHFARDKHYYFFQRFNFSDPMNIKRSTILSDRSPATPSIRTMLRQWYRRTLRQTSSPAPRTLTRPTRLARPMKRTRASRSSTCRIRTFWTLDRRTDREDAFCGPVKLAKRRRSPLTGGRPPLCARDDAWERSVSVTIFCSQNIVRAFYPTYMPFISIILFSIFVQIKKICTYIFVKICERLMVN